MTTLTRVRIFYPADPLGIVPGGIDTFIRGLIKWAPEDLRFSLVGMTTDVLARPVRRFTRCVLGDREFDFFPAVHVASAGQRGRVPLSVRFTVATGRLRAVLARDFDVFEFHRIEPALLFMRDRRPKNAFFHQDPKVLRSAQSDVLWKRLPMAYEAIESRIVRGLSSAWCVRESGVETLRARYPAQADRFRFIPTWVDTDVFSPLADSERAWLRRDWGDRLELDPAAQRIVTVGRLDTQKDPELMVEAFARLIAQGRRLAWLVIGDGVMRDAIEQRVDALGLDAHVRFLGLRSAPEIADLLRASDMYALSSAYEGMPMALLEAMGCGLPAAVTDVGEVRRVVRPGVNGSIAAGRSVEAFAACLQDVLDRLPAYGGTAAVEATASFRPASVLEPVYDNYRELGEIGRRARHGAPASSLQTSLQTLAPRSGYRHRRRERVIGAPIDVLGAAQARETILGWAKANESRYVVFCNVHSAVTYTQDKRHARAVEGADLVAADGAPIAWMLRRKGHAGQPRIDGPGTMWALCGDAQRQRVKIGLYGSSPETLRALRNKLRRAFPELHVSYCESPPFKPLTAAEDEAVCRDIENAGIGLLFVALGCPKQERWMAQHVGRIPAVMLGVGAAFDYHAGLLPRAPRWVQSYGLEWLHRLSSEPRRLWRRYLLSNSVFLMRGATELAGAKVRRRRKTPTVRLTRPVPSRQDLGFQGAHRAKRVNQQYMTELLARVDAAMLRRSGRVIEFIASGEGEGTSTLATAYAHVAATSLNRRVLLLNAQSDSPERLGVLEAIANSSAMEVAITRHAGGYWSGSLLSEEDDFGWALAGRNELWKVLRSGFDEIVLDMPSSSTSRTGVMMAPHCDGVIVVLEAEKTRAPVVEALVASLQAVRANLLGTVLNKRQFHVPDALYRRL